MDTSCDTDAVTNKQKQKLPRNPECEIYLNLLLLVHLIDKKVSFLMLFQLYFMFLQAYSDMFKSLFYD